jgi:cytochrome c-type biogenesis protein CcmH/NrfF
MDVIASHFLAGSILSWAMPILLLLAIGVYWTVLLRRRSGQER